MCIDFQNGFVDDTSGPSLTGWMTEKGEGSKGGDSNFSPVEPEFTVTPLTLHLNGKYVLNFLILRVRQCAETFSAFYYTLQMSLYIECRIMV